MYKNLLLITFSLLVSLAGAEVGLRLFYKPQVKTYPCEAGGHPAYTVKQCPTSQDRINTMRFSGDLLYTPIPNSLGVGWSTDEHGFRRTKPVPSEKLADKPEFRIAVTGGSTAWGVGVKDEQTFPAQLEEALAAKCPGLEIVVWNAAISAQTSGQERRRFETDVLPLKPNIHVALSGFNDVYNSYTGLRPHQNRDYFEVGKRFGVKGVDDFIATPPKPEDYPFKTLYLASLAYFRLTQDPNKASAAIERRALTPEETVSSTLRTAKIFAAWARDGGYEFHYALQPSIYLTRKKLTADEIKIRESDAEFGKFHDKGYVMLRAALESAKKSWPLSFVDTDNAINDETSDLFIDSVHFGDRGYKMLAEFMASYLMRASPALIHNCKAD